MPQTKEKTLGLSQARRANLEARNRNMNQMTLERLKEKWRQKLTNKHVQIANTLVILFEENDENNGYVHLNLFSRRCQEILEELQTAKIENLSLVMRKASDFCAATHCFFDTLDSTFEV